MSKEEIISIYNNTINYVIKDIKPEEYQEISQSYLEYLFRIYENYKPISKKPKDLVKIFTNFETSKWSSLLPEDKESELLKDDAYENIQKISSLAFQLAEKKLICLKEGVDLLPEVTEDFIKEQIQQMESLLPKVRSFNKLHAEILLSETSLDFYYANGRDDISSFRIGHLYS